MIISPRVSFILPYLLMVAGVLVLPAFAFAQVKPPTVPEPSGSSDIVGMNLQNPTGSTIPSGPVQFGQVFKEGDLSGTSGVSLKVNGTTVPAQIDVKTKHSDGSVKFGVVSAIAPALSGNTTNPSMLLGASKTGTPISLSSLSGLDMDVTIAIQGGERFTYDLATLFAREFAAGKVTYWRQGPVVTEGRIDIHVTSSLRLVVDLAKYSDGTYWADIMFNNDRAMTATGGTLKYAATITKGGTTVVSHPDLTHYQYQQWHQEVWSTRESSVNVQRDVRYLLDTNVVANYDTSTGVDQSVINKMNEAVTSANWNKPLSENWITRLMGTTGGRADIGIQTLWNTAWVITQHPTAAKMGLGQANGAAAVPWHYWDPANNTWLNTDNYPKLWIDWRGEPAGKPGDSNSGRPTQQPGRGSNDNDGTNSGGWGPDVSHQPSLNFVPYLFTGKRYLLDQLNAAASWTIMSHWPSGEEYGKARYNEKGLMVTTAFEVRGGAWGLRSALQAAWANPDGSPEKTYFTKISNNNIEWLKSQMATRNTLMGETHGYTVGYSYWSNPTISPWQQDFLLSTLVQAYNFGFTNVKPYLEWSSNWYLGRFLNADNGFNPRDGVKYHIPNNPAKTGVLSKTWRELGANTTAWNPNGFSGWPDSNGYYGQLGIMSTAMLVDTLGSEDAKKVYAWLKTAQPSYTDAATQAKDPTFNVVPKKPIAPASPTNVKVTFTSDRTLVIDGESVTFTWSSQNATNCNGTSLDPAFVVKGTSGSVKVTPKKNSEYMIMCIGDGGPLDFAGSLIKIRYSANPISPDGSSLTVGTSGSLSTADGIWTFGSETNWLGTRVNLNATQDTGGYGVGLYVLNEGKIYLVTNNGWWYNWSGGWQVHYGGDPRTVKPPTTPTEPTDPKPPTTPTPPTDPTVFGTGPDAIKVGLSGDLWGDLPSYNLVLDGKTIGSGRVAANDRLGQIEYISVKGDFGDDRSHTLEIQYYNDAWGGSSATDRNMYVKSLALNDVNLNRSARLTQNGEASFVISKNETVSTVSLTATPSTIVRGQSSFLTLATQNITSCTGTGFTPSGTTSLTAVSPLTTTTYKVTCTGGGGTVSAEVTVTVTIPFVSTTFSLNDRVLTTSGLNVRSTPSITGALLGTQPQGTRGAVVEVPSITADSQSWWKVDFDNSPIDGWSAETYLTKTTTPIIPLPVVTLTVTPVSIEKGQSATLTLTSSEAATCAPTGFTLSGTSGTVTVAPSVTTTYRVQCSNATGSVTKEATVTVNNTPTPPADDSNGTLTPDGSKITTTTGGTLRTADGLWAFSDRSGPSGHRITLNGKLTRGAAGKLLLIANGGKIYAQNNYDKWSTYSNGSWQRTTDPLSTEVKPATSTSTPQTPTEPTPPPVTPATPTTQKPDDIPVFGSGNDTVRLGLSGDTWTYPPQYRLLLDGKTIGEGAVFADNKRSQISYIDVKGDFTSTRRTLIVRYYNDAWGGSADADRNLYVKSVALNGTDQNKSTKLGQNGDATFSFGEEAPSTVQTSPSPATSNNGATLTLEPGQGGSVTDAAGNRWSFGDFDTLGHRIALNGSTARYTGEGMLIVIYNGKAYYRNNINQWFFLTATDWGGITGDPRNGLVQGISDTNPFQSRLSLRSSGEEVESLQWLLSDLGFYRDTVTGYFGPATEAAVKAYQTSRGLEALGVVGPQTRDVLNREW